MNELPSYEELADDYAMACDILGRLLAVVDIADGPTPPAVRIILQDEARPFLRELGW